MEQRSVEWPLSDGCRSSRPCLVEIVLTLTYPFFFDTNSVFFLPKVFYVPGRKFVDLDASWTLRTFFPSAIFNASSPCRTTEIKIEVQSKYRGINCEQLICFQLVYEARRWVSNPLCCGKCSSCSARHECLARAGDFQPRTGFWQSCGTDFWKEPSTSWWEFASKAGTPSSQIDYRRALQLWRSQRTRRILWAGLRRSRKIVPCDCRPLSRFTATLDLTCYLQLAQYSNYFLHLLYSRKFSSGI